MAENSKWYVIHTFSGYEKKVETNIKSMIDNRGLHDRIVDICVPEEEDAEKGPGFAKKKIFPGYVFVKMIMSDDTWHSIRNIRGVTGFVGPDSKPVPLTEGELASMHLEHTESAKELFAINDMVRITDGPLNGYLGKVIEHGEKGKIKLSVDLFMGRETIVDLDSNQVEALDE